ncbi:MAG: alpha/beta hydrolase [Byssovorax sp.]
MPRRALPPLAALLLAACGAPPSPVPSPSAAPPAVTYIPKAPLPGSVQVSFHLPRGPAVDLFDLPWPTELLRTPAGLLDLRGFPGREQDLIAEYLAAAEQDVEGYSVSPAVYFHFTAPIDPARVALSTLSPASRDAVFLVDVDPKSPDLGHFIPLTSRYYPEALRYVPQGTLAVKPHSGFVLRGGTLYAAVVRRDLGQPGNPSPLGTTMELEALKWTAPRPDPVEEKARLLHVSAFDRLAALGVARDDIAAIALFRTQVPEAVTAKMMDVARALSGDKAPRIVSAEWVDPLSEPEGPGGYHTLRGVYCTPNFQDEIDQAPFLEESGGTVRLDAQKRPLLSEVPAGSPYRTPECGPLLRARFVLTIPTSAMPAGGYPLVLSAHGTGGDAYTFLGKNDFAGWAAREGIAVVSTDQPLHGGKDPLGGRPGAGKPVSISIAGFPLRLGSGTALAELSFYNPLYPARARDNLRQASVDGMVLARLMASADLSKNDLLPARPDREKPRFDARRVMAAGHSQGSQSAAVLGAIDPLMRGALLSGCGGDARLGILRRPDIKIAPLLTAVYALSPGELDEYHPFLTVVQHLADPIDPQSYARLYWDPPAGQKPRPVLHYEGLNDTYTPPVTAEALAVALRTTPLVELLSPVPGLGKPEGSPIAEISRPGAGRGFLQYRPTHGENGHFVLYAEAGAAEMASLFMRRVLAE